jgi:hypothetical protein
VINSYSLGKELLVSDLTATELEYEFLTAVELEYMLLAAIKFRTLSKSAAHLRRLFLTGEDVPPWKPTPIFKRANY